MAAISVSTTNKRANHQLIAVTLEARTTWQELDFPDWADGAEIVNTGAVDVYLSTDQDDGDTGTGGVKIAAGASYGFSAGGADPLYMAVRQASGSTYDMGLAYWAKGNG